MFTYGGHLGVLQHFPGLGGSSEQIGGRCHATHLKINMVISYIYNAKKY